MDKKRTPVQPMKDPQQAAPWVHDLSKTEWSEIIRMAGEAAKYIDSDTSLGYEAYASEAISRLLLEPERPKNIKAWLKKVILNILIDRARKAKNRGDKHEPELSEEEIERRMFERSLEPSMASQLHAFSEARKVLNELNAKEQQLLSLLAVGCENHEIADVMGFANGRVVATRLGQIRNKVKNLIQPPRD